jgi:hypothetical protein
MNRSTRRHNMPAYDALENYLLDHRNVLADGFVNDVLSLAEDWYIAGQKEGLASAAPGATPEPGIEATVDILEDDVDTTDPDVIAVAVQQAVNVELEVEIDYVDAYGNATRGRNIAVHSVAGNVLLAYDLGKDDYRTFAVDRITRLVG